MEVPRLFNASKAIPPVNEPSPIIAICLWDLLSSLAASAIPRIAEIDVEECPVPKWSYSLSLIFGNPASPPSLRM